MPTADQDNSGNASGADTFAALFEASTDSESFAKEGEIVTGTVVQIDRDFVIVDIGGKSEGVIPLKEFADSEETGKPAVAVDSKVDVFVESRESDDGLLRISKEKADRLKVWDDISAACEQNQLIEGTISQRVKGGLSVTIKGGVKAFLPGSQVDLRPIRNLDRLIGQTLEFKVTKRFSIFSKRDRGLHGGSESGSGEGFRLILVRSDFR